ncbi:MAG: ribonuclease J [Alphaproteobacteria bacterium]
MTLLAAHPLAGKDELTFLPLGGSNEIGMNLNLYGHAGRWLMVDLGVTFGDDTTPPGVEVIMPDPRFIEEYRSELAGLVLTHGHEDHIGAVPYLWPRLRCPIYATPFTATLVRRKLEDAGLAKEAKLIEVPMSGRFSVGPFQIELITVTHSIPEPNAVVIRTPVGTVLHTGDWKFDADPLVGDSADVSALRALGDEGVMAMVCDSTNVFVQGVAGSEADVRENLTDLIGRCRNRVGVACFASNIARLESIAKAAQAHGRVVALVGRSLWRIEAAARANGYLADLPPFVSEADFTLIPRERALMICTGSQGEPRAALTRIAAGAHQSVSLEPDDTVIFSSRVIPGNERRIGNLQNALVNAGIDVITAGDEHIHVSGHPARDELAEMYAFIRPQIAVPVHGEPRHIREHAHFAKLCQVPQAIAPRNGSLIRLAPGPAEIVDDVFADRLALDGSRLLPLDTILFKDRRRLIETGAVTVTVVLDRKGNLAADLQISTFGLLDEDDDESEEMLDDAADRIADAIEDLSPGRRREDDDVEEAVRRGVRAVLREAIGKKPRIAVHIVRL